MRTVPTKFALRSSRIVRSNGLRDAAILVDAGRIVDVIPPGEIPADYTVQSLGDLVVMPGLVDTHVHVNEPGRTAWEGFETATRAAAAGGITTLVDMPLNSTPVTTSAPALRTKLDSARGKLSIDCGFYAGLVPGNTKEIEPLLAAGALGVKAFLIHSGIDDFPNVSESDLRAAIPVIAAHGVPLLVHCELIPPTPPAVRSGEELKTNPRSYANYLASRPCSWERAAAELMIRLAREYRCRVHIVHVSSADAIPSIREAKEHGVPITAETCPHYLLFSAEEIADGDTRFKCAPPIRERENREQLWDALHDGVIDFIVSDHSPCPPSLKCPESGDFQRAWGGIASLQFGFSVVWTEARRRGYSLSDVARWMSHGPAKFVNLPKKGDIASESDADLVVLDPEKAICIESSIIHHRHPLTPYLGGTFDGVIERTLLRGRTVYERTTGFQEGCGEMLLGSHGVPA